MAAPPPLSIGLPVHNGARYLAAALGSLLDQTWGDYELLIQDNASTDDTGEICQAFAAADARVHYRRNPTNLGAARNYMLTLERARGRFFKWAAHDDVCAPGFLAACMAELAARPELVLCHARSLRIDADGRVTGEYANEVEALDERPSQRFRRMIRTPHYCIPVFGIHRIETLRRTPGHGDHVGADRNLLAELALLGKIRLLPEPLFQRRDHAQSSISAFRDERARRAWFDPAQAGRRTYPTWRRLREYAASIRRAPLAPGDRLACLTELAGWIGGRHHTGARNARLLTAELLG
jgi:glycosyltransferase involved in cell wall biosynthesis